MKRRERSAPIWLFSFVDLAFLLLIAFTQLVPDPRKQGVAIAELALPRIEAAAAAAPGPASDPRWQLRIAPVAANEGDEAERLPFTLVEPGAELASLTPVSAEELATRLELLRARESARPLLTPHRDARAEDLLVAVAMLERVWSNERGVAVQPLPTVPAQPDVAGKR